MIVLAPLAFFAAALVVTVAIVGTVLRYKDSVLTNLAASRDVPPTRDFEFRVFDFGRQAVSVGKVRRGGQRVVTQRPLMPMEWREAA